jgi:hypothetical protein
MKRFYIVSEIQDENKIPITDSVWVKFTEQNLEDVVIDDYIPLIITTAKEAVEGYDEDDTDES